MTIFDGYLMNRRVFEWSFDDFFGDGLPNDRCCEPIQGWSTGSKKLPTPQECRKDKELVLKAVKKDVGSLQFAPQEQWIAVNLFFFCSGFWCF